MVDHHQNQTVVCCMCGDVGFPDKIFRCNKCLYRFQHSYCSNYYGEDTEPIQVCDWCQSEERRHGIGSSSSSSSYSSKKSAAARSSEPAAVSNRSEYAGDKIKLHQRDQETSCDQSNKTNNNNNNNKNQIGTSPSGVPSPRTTTRRYKLLKDVMC